MTDSKICHICGRNTSFDQLVKHKDCPDGVEALCRNCARERNRRWHETHREYERQKAAQARASNPQRHRDAVARYRQQHPRETAEQRRAGRNNRRSKERVVEGRHTLADIRRQYIRQRRKCYYCGIALRGRYQVDHVIPISRGGTNGPENLVITCSDCNLRKGNKLPHEWTEGGRLL